MQDSVCDCFMTVQSITHFYTVAEKWRVILKGESKDYIHASFANVCKNTKSLRHTVSLFPKLSHRLVLIAYNMQNCREILKNWMVGRHGNEADVDHSLTNTKEV